MPNIMNQAENLRNRGTTRGDTTPNILDPRTERGDKKSRQNQLSSNIFHKDVSKQNGAIESQKILKHYKQIMNFNKKRNEEKSRCAPLTSRMTTGNVKNANSVEFAETLQSNKTPNLLTRVHGEQHKNDE